MGKLVSFVIRLAFPPPQDLFYSPIELKDTLNREKNLDINEKILKFKFSSLGKRAFFPWKKI